MAEYVSKDAWPECIPTAPATDGGVPSPWPEKSHSDPHGVDSFPHSHPAADAVGEDYLGSVCPYCGVPLKWDEEVVTPDGDRGVFYQVDDDSGPTVGYHPPCWTERRAEVTRLTHTPLSEFE